MEDLSDRPHPNAGDVVYVLDGTSMLYKVCVPSFNQYQPDPPPADRSDSPNPYNPIQINRIPQPADLTGPNPNH